MPPRSRTKTVTIRLTEEEFAALSTLARRYRKPVTSYLTEETRALLRGRGESGREEKESLLELTKEIREALDRLHEGLCYGTLKLLQKDTSPSFVTDEEAHEWVSRKVGRRE